MGEAPPPFTLADLRSWELHGATWRAVELSERHAVVELCSCFGEPVDMVQSDLPELIEYVRSQRAD